MKFKLNKYLYFKNDGKRVHIVNLLNDYFFTIRKSKAEMILNGQIDLISQKDPKLFDVIQKLDIIIPEEQDPLDLIRMKNRKMIFADRTYRLTINPTLECNFSCWYCYEKHPEGKMSAKIMSSVINHIKKKIEDEKISSLIIDWFGGEPLLYFDEIMYPLLVEIKKITDINNVSFISSATTNGFLIDEKRVKQFEKVNLTQFQITLDGNKEQHNKIRFTTERKGSFDEIIRGVNLLAKIKNVNILLRINYIKQTLINIDEIIPQLSQEARSKVKIHFQQVWQDSMKHKISCQESEKKFIESGLKVDEPKFNTKGYTCYADKLQQAVINFDGKVFKCTARDFVTYPEDGILSDSGDIDWNIQKISKRFGKATFENEHCINCNFLPVCYGPCSQKMIEFEETDSFEHICLKGGVIDQINREIEKLK